MSEQGSRPGRQPDAADRDYRDRRATEEEILHAFAKIRLLDDANRPASPKQFAERARQEKGPYEQWMKSGAPIRGIVVRRSNGERAEFAFLRGSQCSIRCTADLPAGTFLDILKEADEEFGEVLLLRLSLPKASADGITVERSYPNGQTLSLRVEPCSDAVLSIAVKITEPDPERSNATGVYLDASPYRISMEWLQQLLGPPRRIAFAAAFALVLMMSGLWPSFQRNFGRYKSIELARHEEELAAVPMNEVSREDPAIMSLRELDRPRDDTEVHSPPAPSAYQSSSGKRGVTQRARVGHSSSREAFTPATVVIRLDAYEMVRGEEEPAKRVLHVYESTKIVRVFLQLPYDVNPGRHDIVLTRADGQLLAIRLNSGADRVIRLTMPSGVLSEGDYTLRVSCDDGPPIRYEFKVAGREVPHLHKGDETPPADEPRVPKPMEEPSEI